VDGLNSVPQTPEGRKELLASFVTRLMEHFDTVQIFVTHREEDKLTGSLVTGQGNWYARYGSVKEWLMETEAMMGYVNHEDFEEEIDE
jgi:hypothetical protein